MRFLLVFLLFFSGVLAISADELSKNKAAFKIADAELNKVYAQARKEMKPEVFKSLQEDQRNWIKYRDSMSNAQKWIFKEDPMANYWRFMASLSEKRRGFIKAWIEAKPDQDRWVGEYSDGYGGYLEITKDKGGTYSFKITVVRGPTGHIGEISGKMEVNMNRGRFSDHRRSAKDSESDEESWLDFVKMGDGVRIKVIETNTSLYCGMGAYFSGIYLRMK